MIKFVTSSTPRTYKEAIKYVHRQLDSSDIRVTVGSGVASALKDDQVAVGLTSFSTLGEPRTPRRVQEVLDIP